jgi:hypothetical protein
MRVAPGWSTRSDSPARSRMPLTQELQRRYGWSIALVLLGAVIAVLTPAARLLNDASCTVSGGAVPKEPSQSMVAAVREAARHRGFWLFSLGFTACGFQVAFIAAHLPAYLLDKGLDARAGIAGLAIIALANVASMYFFGSRGGLYRRKYLLAGIYLARVAVIALFLLHDLRHTWASWHRQAGTSCDELKDLGGWKSRQVVDRYAKFATENLLVAASRIETGRDAKALEMARFRHG